MKSAFISLAFFLIGSLASAKANSIEMEEASIVTAATEEGFLAAPVACWIVQITVSCGGTYNTQYCNEGLHGTLIEWVMQVDDWACNRQR